MVCWLGAAVLYELKVVEERKNGRRRIISGFWVFQMEECSLISYILLTYSVPLAVLFAMTELTVLPTLIIVTG